LTGLSLGEAETLVGQAGLSLEVAYHETDQAPPDTVLDQRPDAGSLVPLGSGVNVLVARMPETVVVPQLVGAALDDARSFADAHGLRLDVVPRETADAPPDTILEQQPPEGTALRYGDTLSVVAAATPATTLVPGLRGLTEDAALTALAESGLTNGRRLERFNGGVAQGLVVRSDPAEGAEVPLGTAVDYVISRGAEPTVAPTPRSVPDLIGSSLEDAGGLAREHGLRLDVRFEEVADAPANIVVSQDPSAGSPAELGDTVHVVVSRADAPAERPRGPDGPTAVPGHDPTVDGAGPGR
jgi:serine/threonine-protein kinase